MDVPQITNLLNTLASPTTDNHANTIVTIAQNLLFFRVNSTTQISDLVSEFKGADLWSEQIPISFCSKCRHKCRFLRYWVRIKFVRHSKEDRTPKGGNTTTDTKEKT